MSTDTGYPPPKMRRADCLCDVVHEADCQNIAPYAPLAEACIECGAYIEQEEHDSECFGGWVTYMLSIHPEYTDDTSDWSDR